MIVVILATSAFVVAFIVGPFLIVRAARHAEEQL